MATIRRRRSRIRTRTAVVRVLVLAVFALIVARVPSPAHGVHPGERARHHVLLLHSYAEGLLWGDDEVRGIRSVLCAPGSDVDLHVEYMDTKHFALSRVEEPLAALLRAKYADDRFDAVIAVDNSALEFVLKRRALFGGAPVVFCGINDFSEEMIAGHPDVTGVAEDMDIRETVLAALRAVPGARRVVAVCDQTPTGLANASDFRKAVSDFGPAVRFEGLSGLTAEELAGRLRALPEDAVVLLFTFHQDASGRYFETEDFLKLVCENAPVPVFGLWRHYAGRGVVGGIVTSGEEHGRAAAAMVRRVLDGEPASSIPVLRKSPNVPVFDWKQLRRFGIDPQTLPPGSRIVNRPVPFYVQYRNWFLAGSAAGGALLVLLVALIAEVVRRHRIERDLRASEESYRSIVETANEGIMVLDADFSITFVNASLAKLLGYEPAEMLGRQVTDFFFPEDIPDHEARIAERRAGRRGQYERRFVCRDGTSLLMLLSAAPVKNGAGGFAGSFAMLSDITERKRTEEALRRSELQYRMIADNVNDVIWKLDIETLRFTYASPSVFRARGYTPEEAKAIPLEESVDRASYEWVCREMKRRLEAFAAGDGSERVRTNILREKRKDGVYNIVEVVSTLLTDADGRVTEVLGVSRDITERRQAEEALLRSEERIRFLVQQMPAILWSVDRELRFTFGTGAGLAALNAVPSELQGRSLQDFFGTDDPSFPGVLAHRRALSGETVDYVLNVFGRSYECHVRPLTEEDGTVSGVLGLAYDVTDRKKIEEDLWLKNRAIETAITGIVFGDLEGRIIYANPSVVRLWGYRTREEVIGRRYTDFCKSPKQVTEIVRALEEKGTWIGELTGQRKDGSTFDAQVSASMVPDEQGRPQHLMASLLDITDRKHAREQLAESYRKLEQSMDEIIYAITKIVETRDPYTAGHQRRVADLSAAIAKEMGLDRNTVAAVHLAGLLHDIGKIYVPSEILSKPGLLTLVEFSIIRLHPETAYDILKPIQFDWPVADIVIQHHERLNGSGYPHGIKGDSIMIEARVIAAADVVEAMAFHRPYRAALGIDAAIDELRKNRGILYDAAVVDACLSLLTSGRFAFRTGEA